MTDSLRGYLKKLACFWIVGESKAHCLFFARPLNLKQTCFLRSGRVFFGASFHRTAPSPIKGKKECSSIDFSVWLWVEGSADGRNTFVGVPWVDIWAIPSHSLWFHHLTERKIFLNLHHAIHQSATCSTYVPLILSSIFFDSENLKMRFIEKNNNGSRLPFRQQKRFLVISGCFKCSKKYKVAAALNPNIQAQLLLVSLFENTLVQVNKNFIITEHNFSCRC